MGSTDSHQVSASSPNENSMSNGADLSLYDFS